VLYTPHLLFGKVSAGYTLFVKRFLELLTFSLCGSAVVVALFVARSPALSFGDVERLFAGFFFTESSTPEALQAKYSRAHYGGDKLRVLIVPGHDDDAWGTEFNGIREADMTVALGEELTKLLSADPAFEPLLLRSRAGYASGFLEYVGREEGAIQAFIQSNKQTMRELIRAGSVHLTTGVIHNTAPSAVALKLYAANRFANEHGVDIVLHIHFNDYPGRSHTRAGRYNGFSIYIPDSQFSNARASRSVAEALFAQFSKFYAESNLPIEDSGIVPDQELIATGAYNTLDPAGVLIEYGYIYEQRFLNEAVRAAMLRELAFQTYQGLNRFFGKYGELFQKYPTTLLPHEWNRALSAGSGSHPSILSLQAALLFEELYPPAGENKRGCPLSGSFGPCTALAVKGFQQKYGLPPTGAVGPQTMEKLNEKYGR